MRGRNSFAPLRKMGVANIINGKIPIADLGYKLLKEEITPEDFGFMSFFNYIFSMFNINDICCTYFNSCICWW